MNNLDARLTALEAIQTARAVAAEYCQCNNDAPYANIRVREYRAGEDDPAELCPKCGKEIDVCHIVIVYDQNEVGNGND